MARALHKHSTPTTPKLGPYNTAHINREAIEIQAPSSVSTCKESTVDLSLGDLPSTLTFAGQTDPSQFLDPEITRPASNAPPSFFTLTIGETTIAIDLREAPSEISPKEFTPEQLKFLAEFGNLLSSESVQKLIELEAEAKAQLERRHQEDLNKKAEQDKEDKAPFSLTIYRNPKDGKITVKLSEGLQRKAALIQPAEAGREIKPIDLTRIVSVSTNPGLAQTVSRGNGEDQFHAKITLDQLTGRLIIEDGSSSGTEVTNSIQPNP
jgi:hypothetical protein